VVGAAEVVAAAVFDAALDSVATEVTIEEGAEEASVVEAGAEVSADEVPAVLVGRTPGGMLKETPAPAQMTPAAWMVFSRSAGEHAVWTQGARLVMN